MARKSRADGPGCWHHVMHRGARREPIFFDHADCLTFFDLLGRATKRKFIEIHAYALMPNHYHLLVRSPQGGLSRGMQYLNGCYTQRVNRRKGYDGPLFRGRFHSRRVADPSHLKHLLAYIHLNPVQAHLAPRVDDVCWTSHRAYLKTEPSPPWLVTGVLLDLFNGPKGLTTYVHEVHTKRTACPEGVQLEIDQPLSKIPIDEETAKNRPDPTSISAKCHLQRLCRQLGVSSLELRRSRWGRGGNAYRRFAVWILHQETSLTHREIALELKMPRETVTQTLFRLRSEGLVGDMRQWALAWRARQKSKM